MKKSEAWFSSPTRQAPIAILLIIFNVIKSLIRTWWPFLLILFFRGDFLDPAQGKIITALVTVFIIFFSIWQYFRFTFFINSGKLHVQHGIWKRVKLDIPFDRIQSISFEQNIIHQLFKVVKIKVDTAGSSGEEFEFSALDRAMAEDLRNFILERRKSTVESAHTSSKLSQRKDQLILSLQPIDLIKVGISQNHLRTAGIILAFLLGLRDRISESLGDQYVDRFDALTENVIQSGVYYILALFFALLVFSFFGTLIFTVIRYYNLHFWKTAAGYKTEAGLFNKREQAALHQKIQILRWVSNPLRKLFGIVYLRLYQASSAVGSRRTTISVPGCPVEDLEEVKQSYFRQSHTEFPKLYGVDHRLFYRRLLFIGLLPTLLISVVASIFQHWEWIAIAILWLLFSAFYQYQFQHKWWYNLTANTIQTTYGVVERVSKILFLYKVQSVQIRTTPYQRRHGLASIILHTASGDVRIPYVKRDHALQLKNYILYKIESSQRSWM